MPVISPVEFKIMEKSKYAGLRDKPKALPKNAVAVGRNQKRKFRVDISKFEFCEGKIEEDLDGYTIYVYSPEMIVLEKLRAICQQMPEYAKKMQTHSAARARDFFDIYTIIEHCKIDLESSENVALLENIFEAKKVPLTLLGRISQYKEFHRPDFASVKDTVRPNVELKEFDFYFDYVIEKTAGLKALWEV